MSDIGPIHTIIARVRKRMRLQSALDWGARALVLAVPSALAVMWLWRMEELSSKLALEAIVALGIGVVATAGVAALGRLPVAFVAARLDRASGLSSRLSTACEFAETSDDAELHPETRVFMELAVIDGIRAAGRANVKAAAPLGLPKDAREVAIFGGLGLATALLAFGPSPTQPVPREPVAAPIEGTRLGIADEDVDFSREILAELRELAKEGTDPELQELANQVDALLDKAGRGELIKEQLLTAMDELEKRYAQSGGIDLKATLEELKESGRTLAKEPGTRKLGVALKDGDLAATRAELEKLAERLKAKALDLDAEKRLAEALAKAAKNFEEREKKREDREAQAIKDISERIAKRQAEIRRLERKLAENPKQTETRRRLDREKRELARLEREKQEQEAPTRKRELARLHRNLDRAAEDLRNQKPRSSQSLRDAAQDAQGIEDEIRKLGNRERTRSQLADLKEALSRARPRAKGAGKEAERLARLKDYARRSTGKKGDPQAWKPRGQSRGQALGGKESRTRGENASDQPGNQHDPNVVGDPTQHYGKTHDEAISGVHGRGASRKETVVSSAQRGFAGTDYRRVYADYRKVAEEVMNQEKVPQGYKYYVKQYFQRIKPSDGQSR